MTSARTTPPPGSASDRQPVRRGSRPALLAAIAVGVVLALLVVLLFTREVRGERIASADLVGRPAPGLDGDIVLGEDFDLGASDRWVVVNFFATWCVPCIVEHPELEAFADEHAETGLARVVSVVYEADAGAAQSVKDFFERNGGDWTVFDADEGRTSVDWGVAAVPESYLVAPSGIVVERFVGGVTQAGLNAVIDAFQNQEGP